MRKRTGRSGKKPYLFILVKTILALEGINTEEDDLPGDTSSVYKNYIVLVSTTSLHLQVKGFSQSFQSLL